MTIEVHHLVIVRASLGPGVRAGVFVQGCSLGCPGCFNAQTHPPGKGTMMPVYEIVEWVLRSGVEGVTITGGEPTDQPAATAELARALRAAGVDSILLYSGRTMEEICALPDGPDLLRHVDVLIDGRFEAKQLEHDLLKGSTNQEIYLLTDRHTADAFVGRPGAAIVKGDGGVLLLGFAAPRLARHLAAAAGD